MRPLKALSSVCHDTSSQILLAKTFHIAKPQVSGEEVYSFHRQITCQWAWIIILQSSDGWWLITSNNAIRQKHRGTIFLILEVLLCIFKKGFIPPPHSQD